MRTISTFLLLIIGIACSNLIAQSIVSATNPWQIIEEKNIDISDRDHEVIPDKYATLQLELNEMKKILSSAPLWRTSQAQSINLFIDLPMPDGSFQQFKVEYAPIMHEDLARRYPYIRTYVGYGVDDPTAYVRFDLTQKGFHAFVRSAPQSDVYIVPHINTHTAYYISYYKSDVHQHRHWNCDFDEFNDIRDLELPDEGRMAGDCTLRTYRLALACTGEYAQFHGGNVPDVLAAMVTSMNRVNGVFEIDASVTMELVPNTDELIFLNAATDPYTNNNGGAMLGQNQTTCDDIIGSANYDIGHVFSTGGGGVAYLGSVCNNNIKAGGVTGLGNPIGDPFDIDYVSHEIGHQFAGTHTQNNDCNRSNVSAMEPGSASTIMGYAGICAPNVQNNSDAYFHAVTLQQMGTFTSVFGGSSCSSDMDVNDPPIADAGLDYIVPHSTFLVLEGKGEDMDGNTITYCWEQMDNEVANMPPEPTNTAGPAFRSIAPTASPNRYLPNLSDIVNNNSPTWEVLPGVARQMNFRLTVRDNQIGGGCTDEDDMQINVAGNSGPFLVTAPNTAVDWPALSQQTVTWDVANTDNAPVNCDTVDIYLSIDGGFTYPIILATNTLNDGSHLVNVPNNQTTEARIMVRGSENIFFDISNQDFTISAPTNGFTVDVSPDVLTACVPNDTSFTVDIMATGSFMDEVTLSVNGVPAGITTSFSTNPVNTTGTSQLSLTGVNMAALGSYNLEVIGTNNTLMVSEMVTLIISDVPTMPILMSPADGMIEVSTNADLSWDAVAGATSYELQVATDGDFNNLIIDEQGINTTNFVAPLNSSSFYYWRVRAVNPCGISDYSEVFSFSTDFISCDTYSGTDVPVAISASGTVVVTSTLDITDSGAIDDLNLIGLDVSHTWINDLIITLTSPVGTQVTLINRICNGEDNILINLDDEAINTYNDIPCPPINNDTYQPENLLALFDGEDLNGTWTLTIEDVFNQDGGALNGWNLEICYANEAAPLVATLSGTDVLCFGDSTATAEVLATGGTGTYTYEWSNGATTHSIDNLIAGTYTVTITSGAEMLTQSIDITEPANELSVTISADNTSCGQANGQATVMVTGGTMPYTYLWSNDSTDVVIANLQAGDYEVTVTDANGCTTTASATIAPSSGITSDVSSTEVSCNGGNDGTATATGMNGVEPYTYLWSNMQTTSTITDLVAGTYDCTITDANNCTTTISITVGQPDILDVTTTEIPTTCGLDNGQLIAIATGGTSPYDYDWGVGATDQISDLAAGTYTVTVMDANDCTATATAIVEDSESLQVSTSTTSVSCFNGSDGTATVAPVNGASPYSYDWGIFGDTPTITGLSAGTYMVAITDASGCTTTADAMVTQPASAVTVSVTAVNTRCGEDNGSADATATGGTSPYQYAWSNGATTSEIDDLPADNYSLTVTDANNCEAVTMVTVGASAAILIDFTTTDVSCNGENDGSATAVATNGTPPYTYLWSNGATNDMVSGLGAGEVTVTVTDANNCSTVANTTISEPNPLTVSITGTNPTTGNSDGAATANASGGSMPYSYDWGTGFGDMATITDLGAGDYTVTVTDDQGCSSTATITLTEQVDGPCNIYASSDVPVTITANGTPTVTSTLEINTTGVISDVNVLNVGIDHTWINDLVITLRSPLGTEVRLINRICGKENDILTNLDDEGLPYTSLPCPPIDNGVYRPFDDLAAFTGEAPNGTWTLTVQDVFNLDGGALNTWSLEICTTTSNGDCTTQTFDDNDFEEGWGIWNDGGSDCRRSANDAAYANSGTYCIRLRDNTNTSVMETDNLNIANYEELGVSFSYYVRSFDNPNEDFWLQISQDGGDTYTTVEEWSFGEDFLNDERRFGSVIIPGPFTNSTRLQFRCDASSNSDWVYIDDVRITGCAVNGLLAPDHTPVLRGWPTATVTLQAQQAEPASTLSVFPNPANDLITVRFTASQAKKGQLLVMDVLGQIVIEQPLILSEEQSDHQLELGIADLISGTYFLMVIEGDIKQVTRFVKQ
jgi:subtilisin-like proprotein convertase family protein